MELRHLRYFVAVARRLNFTAAARDMHVTQSTLSHQIQQLEDEIGYPLFDRGKRNITLTRAGDVLLPRFAQALEEIDGAVRMVKEAAGGLSGEVRILIGTHAFGVGLLPECLELFRAHNAAIRVLAEEVLTLSFEGRLHQGQYDFGVGPGEPGSDPARFEPLYTEELCLVVARDHPLARRKKIRMIELHRQPLVLPGREDASRRIMDDCLASVGAEPNVVAEVTMIDSMFQIARRTDIATIMGHNVMNFGDVAFVAIEDPTPMRILGLHWKPGLPVTPQAALFADAIRQTVLTASDNPDSMPRIRRWSEPRAAARPRRPQPDPAALKR